MYIQDKFREERVDRLHAFMRAHALATVIVAIPRLEAFLMPLEIVSGEGGFGVLRGHVVRANHLSQAPRGSEALAVFQGSNAYISPRWYVNGQSSGRVAPSWNFATVHASGSLRWIDDAAWMQVHLASLADLQESGRPNPWQLDAAPREFIDGLVQRLVGLEIRIERLEGKRFLSQQRTPEDRASLARHLSAESRGAAHDVARAVAAIDAPDEAGPQAGV